MPLAASWSRTTFSCRDRVWMAYQCGCSGLSITMPVLFPPPSTDVPQYCGKPRKVPQKCTHGTGKLPHFRDHSSAMCPLFPYTCTTCAVQYLVIRLPLVVINTPRPSPHWCIGMLSAPLAV